jgi:hypothetical protein
LAAKVSVYSEQMPSADKPVTTASNTPFTHSGNASSPHMEGNT